MKSPSSETPSEAEVEKLLAIQPVIYNHFIEISDHPEKWPEHEHHLDAALRLLACATAYSLRHHSPPPLWTEVGSDACDQWRRSHPDHPMSDERRASERQRAGQEVMTWAWCSPQAFTPERLKMLHDCLPDCDASIRFDLLRCIGFLGDRSARDSLRELVAIESESPNCRAMASVLLHRFDQ
jgi:hypothetical protein